MNKTKIRSILFSIVCLLAIALSITAMVFGLLYCDSLHQLNVADAAAPVRQGLRFNQLFSYDYLKSGSYNGVTISNDGLGSLSFVGNTASNTVYNITSLVKNHYYYISSNSNLRCFQINEPNYDIFNNYVHKVKHDNINLYLCLRTNIVTDGFTIKPILIDLTEMFGAGNEPMTLEDVQKYIVPGTYYPYTPIVGEYQQGYEDGYSSAITGFDSLFDIYNYSIGGTKQGTPVYLGSKENFSYLPSKFQLPYFYFRMSDIRWDETIDESYPYDVSPGKWDESRLDITFNNFYDVATWLKNNPNDYLCTYQYVDDIAQPYAIVFQDLSKLDSYLQGGGAFYDKGFDAGVEQGKNTGYDSGYKDGKKEGLTIGRDEGYKKGIEGKNSFTDLANSIVMVPVQGITSLFNFELFGFNVADLVLALLTMCIVFGIINLIMARRG